MAAQTLRIPAPTGMWTEGVRWNIPKDKAYDIENFLVDRPGELRPRGPLSSAKTIFPSATTATGIWVFGEKFLVSKHPTSKLYDTDASTVTDVALTSTARQLDDRSARLGSYAYGPSTDAATGLLRWDGTSSEPIALTHAPKAAADVCVHLERLFVAGGTEPNTASPVKSTTLWWTDAGGATTNTLVDWQDDVSGLTNQIQVGDDGDAIVALQVLGRTLLVFKTHSIWAVYGDSPSSFTVRKIADALGLKNKTSTAVIDDLCVFVTADGAVRRFDGAQFGVFRGLDTLLRSSTTAYVTRLVNDHVYIFDGTYSYLLYLPTGGWTRVEYWSTVVAAGSLSFAVTELGRAFLFDSTSARDLDDVPLPTSVVTRFEAKKDGSGNLPITLGVTYRTATFRDPFRSTVVRRLVVDHSLRVLSGTTPTWSIELDDPSSGTSLSTETVAAEPSGGREIVRHLIELHTEITDLDIEILLDTASGTDFYGTDSGSIYDVWLEIETAQRR